MHIKLHTLWIILAFSFNGILLAQSMGDDATLEILKEVEKDFSIFYQFNFK